MKILHILEPFSYGGVEKMVLSLCINSNKSIDEVHVAAPESLMPNIDEHFKNNANTHIFRFSKNPLVYLKEIKQVIKKVQPDIIHTHARRMTFFTSLVCDKWTHVRTYHMQENEKIPKTPFENFILNKRVHGWAVTWNGIIKTDLTNIHKNIPIKVIPNGVSEILTSKKNMNKETINLLFVGRLSYQKGLDIFLNAFSQLDPFSLSKIQLKIVGEGDLEQEFKKVASNIVDSNIQFEGFQKNISEYYAWADILIMPSRYEGLPLTLIESMSAKTPVVSTKVGAAVDIISHNENGWLIEENSVEYWRSYLNEIINFGIESIISKGEKAYKTYYQDYQLEKMCERYEAFYEETILAKERRINDK